MVVLMPLFLAKNAGLDGASRVTVSVPSIITTDDITGRAAGSPWTHSSPMWMHLSTSPSRKLPLMLGSTSSVAVPASQCSHTCTVVCNNATLSLASPELAETMVINNHIALTVFKRSPDFWES